MRKKAILLAVVLVLMALAAYPALAALEQLVWLPLVEQGYPPPRLRDTPTPAPTETPQGWTPPPTYWLCWPPDARCATPTPIR